ncbi:MAG: flagellar biosynthetic protein FliO [Chitinispirillaceae bacterium]|nr:flagellar biosynthetic protein FliO [Chitinispirillaceae bacterium]
MRIGTPAVKNSSFIHLPMALLLLCFCAGALHAQHDDIGGFDIDKVREATRYADTGLADAPVPKRQEESMVMLVLRIMLYLGIVITLILVVSWFFKQKGLQAVRGGGGAMDIIETLPIGQNRMLMMVRILDEIYLVSQTATSISLLDKIGGQKAVDIISSSKGGGTIMNFKDAFNSFMGKMKKPV